MATELIFDIVIAGGGTSACVVAGRLAAADPNLKILAIEAGPPTFNDPAHTQPAVYVRHLFPGSETMKFVEARPSEALGGRSAIVPAAQCVGGGSAVNFTMYTRAAASDYDDWETVHGNPGWGYKDLLPYLKKCETYQVVGGLETHGYSGPLKVSTGGINGNIGEDFLEVGAKYDKKREFTTDVNGLVSGSNEYGYWPKWIDGDTGRRSDTAHHYVYNQYHNKNLVVLTGYLVKRVIFENGRAVGVEFLPHARYRPDEPNNIRVARATRQVVVSAGTLGSSLILERSGIGSKKILEPLGISTVVDLPGVGDKYQDHQGVFPAYFASEESLTLDAIIHGDKEEIERWMPQWVENGKGLLANNGLDSGLKLRPSEEELKEIGPDFEARWKTFFADAPDKPALYIGPLAMFSLGIAPRKYFSLLYFLEHPAALGYIHITSGDDANAPPDFDPAYLTGSGDLALLIWGYKRSREYARRMRCYCGEFLPAHPTFPPHSEAVCRESAKPVPINTPDIKWTEEDDKIIENHVRAIVATTWHSLGTCAMKPRENGGVVDTRLNVYGVEGLKVVDLSVAPGNVAANTYSTALAIAERAAVIIAEDLGIDGV